MSDWLVSAEIQKLAGLLGQDVERFDYLAALDPADIRALREAATTRLFDADRAIFERLAAGARVVPDGLAATLSQRAFGPLLTGRLTSMIDPPKAVSVAAKLPLDFMADVAVQLDPRRASAVLCGLAPDKIAGISLILARRGEFVAMGRFVAHLQEQAIRAVINVLDDESLLRIAPFIEDGESAAHVVDLLGSRLDSLRETAHERDLRDELDALLEAA